MPREGTTSMTSKRTFAECLILGREEGERDAKLAMARSLKSMGVLTVEQIAATTGLSAEEIEKL